MKARLPKGYGRPDPNAMMRQVQKMQDDIRAKQEELEAKEYTGTASGEMVTVTMNGKSVMKHLNPYRCKFREEKVQITFDPEISEWDNPIG